MLKMCQPLKNNRLKRSRRSKELISCSKQHYEISQILATYYMQKRIDSLHMPTLIQTFDKIVTLTDSSSAFTLVANHLLTFRYWKIDTDK